MDMTKSMLNGISSNSFKFSGGYSTGVSYADKYNNNPYKIDNPYSNDQEDISWLLGQKKQKPWQIQAYLHD